MKLIQSLKELKKAELAPSAAALGTFDGIHLGHQEVIGSTGRYARSHGLSLMVFTFSNHPMANLMPELEPKRLVDNETKIRLMENLSVDVLVNIPFDKKLASISADDFLTMLVQAGVKAVGIGDNFSFGAGGRGNVDFLKAEHARFGLTILARPLLKLEGEIVSSTNIRHAIADGNMDLANKMLGRPYEIHGRVIKGDQRGRLLGFPTANMQLLGRNIAIPSFGVYAGQVRVNKTLYGAMVNIGNNPTFANQHTRLEAHLFNFDGDLYGKDLRVRLLHKVRDEIKFKSKEDLITQMKKDQQAVQALL